jgi:HAD superfamily hydrolase (TIGR01509 family)
LALPTRRRRVRAARAVVFDVDGTLADSEPLAGMAWDSVLAPYGVSRTEADDQVVTGRSFASTRDHYAARAPDLPAAEVLWEPYAGRLLELLAGRLQPHRDAMGLLASLRARGVPVALASSSPRARMAVTLDTLGLADLGVWAIAGDEVREPKPAPDAFLAAARLLGVHPQDCVAVEDSSPGVAAARAAGMTVVAVRREPWADLAAADLVVHSLTTRSLDGFLAARA